MNKEFAERWLSVAACISLLAAWFLGLQQAQADVMPYLSQVVPRAVRFASIGENIYAAYSDTSSSALPMSYISLQEATGYGGPMKLAIAVDLQGQVTGFTVIENRETPSFFRRVYQSKFPATLLGKTFTAPFTLGIDLDGISGATFTSRAIALAVAEGSRAVAVGPLQQQVPPAKSPSVQFGLPEIALLGLYAMGFVGHRQKFKYTRQVRWFSMLTGLVLIGFWLNRPLTIANVNQLLLGFWPTWQNNLYWYLMLGGILFVFSYDNKNPYCEWFCPFGAAQECLGVIGAAKVQPAGQFKNALKWLQRGLAWFAVLLALLFRNPGISSYEVFGTLFDLSGSTIQFALLGIILISAIFIKRPWCSYLCPIKAVDEFIRLQRKWLIAKWKNSFHKQNVSSHTSSSPSSPSVSS